MADGKVGAPKGNRNAAKSHLWDDAFRRELKQRDLKDGDGETIRRIVSNIIDMALAKDLSAATFMRDTTDGKPKQQIDASVSGSVHVTISNDDARVV